MTELTVGRIDLATELTMERVDRGIADEVAELPAADLTTVPEPGTDLIRQASG